MMRPFLAVIVLGLALTACSGEAQSYRGLSDLRAAIDSAGVSCDRLDPGPEAQLVSESGTCAESGVTLYTFGSAEDLENWKRLGTRLGPTLIGPDWAVAGDPGDLQRIASETGGDLVDGEGED